jgi:hypothetical protein
LVKGTGDEVDATADASVVDGGDDGLVAFLDLR